MKHSNKKKKINSARFPEDSGHTHNAKAIANAYTNSVVMTTQTSRVGVSTEKSFGIGKNIKNLQIKPSALATGNGGAYEKIKITTNQPMTTKNADGSL